MDPFTCIVVSQGNHFKTQRKIRGYLYTFLGGWNPLRRSSNEEQPGGARFVVGLGNTFGPRPQRIRPLQLVGSHARCQVPNRQPALKAFHHFHQLNADAQRISVGTKRPRFGLAEFKGEPVPKKKKQQRGTRHWATEIAIAMPREPKEQDLEACNILQDLSLQKEWAKQILAFLMHDLFHMPGPSLQGTGKTMTPISE